MSEKYQCIKTTAKDLKETYKNETMDKIFEDFAEALNDYQDFGCESCKAQDKLKDKIAELESKLAESVEIINEWMKLNIEKSAEIHRLKQLITEEKNRNKKLNHEAQKYYEDAYCNGFQNKKAIEELERLKEGFNGAFSLSTQQEMFDKYIDQQIKSLKGEK